MCKVYKLDLCFGFTLCVVCSELGCVTMHVLLCIHMLACLVGFALLPEDESLLNFSSYVQYFEMLLLTSVV